MENETVDVSADETPSSFVVELSEDNTPQNIEADSSSSDDSPKEESREEFGKRAEKRIRGLVSESKELKGLTAKQEAELKRLREEVATLKKEQETSVARQIELHQNRVEAERKAAEQDYRNATAVEDTDKQIDALRRLQQAETQSMALAARAAQIAQEAENSTSNEEAPVQNQQPAITDPRTLEWVEKNPWVKSLQDPNSSEEDREMARFAGRLHDYATGVRQLDPIEDADEYWKQIDEGLRAEYPERFQVETREQEETPAPTQAVGGPRRPARSSRKVKLTQQQLDFARRYNITPEEMAKQQAALEARRGE